MKKFNRGAILAAAAFVGLSGLADQASASLYFSEPFDYPTPGTLAGKTNAGSGQTWDFFGTGTGGTLSLATSDVPYPAYTGLTAPVTNASARPTGATYSGNGYDRLQLGSTVTTGSIFYSLTLNVADISGANFRTNTAGVYVAGLRNDSTFNNVAAASRDASQVARLSIRNVTPGVGDTGPNSGVSTGYVVGIQNVQNGTDTSSRVFDTSQSFVQGETVFIVVEHVFNGGAADDVANLYINPAVGPQGTPDVLSVSATTDIANISGFVLRSNSTLPAATLVDNIKVGNTWADVAPIPEPTSLAMLGLAGAGMLARRRRA